MGLTVILNKALSAVHVEMPMKKANAKDLLDTVTIKCFRQLVMKTLLSLPFLEALIRLIKRGKRVVGFKQGHCKFKGLSGT